MKMKPALIALITAITLTLSFNAAADEPRGGDRSQAEQNHDNS